MDDAKVIELFNLVVIVKDIRESIQKGRKYLITSTGLWISILETHKVENGKSYSLSGQVVTYEGKPKFEGFFINECPVKEIPFE